MALELTTVADDLAVFHDGPEVSRFDGLEPDTEYELLGVRVRTLRRPRGERLSTVVTVNDVHFGETECGVVDRRPDGPILRPEPGEPPYPETMNRAAVTEILAVEPDVVVVKGDLSDDGNVEEWAAFEDCYRTAFGDRLFVVRGNHDAYHGQDAYTGDQWIEVPGLTIALLDTVVPTKSNGSLRPHQLAELDAELARRPGRVLVLGHHQQWIPGPPDTGHRSEGYFGIDADASDALDEVCARNPHVIGYAGGHTHRHRVRTMARSRIPTIEVGCVKDFPGTWAEYRVYEGGVIQVVHRISAPDALSWSDRCRVLYRDFGVDYVAYALGVLGHRCFVFPERATQ